LPARHPVRRKQRRPGRPVRQQQPPREASATTSAAPEPAEASVPATTVTRDASTGRVTRQAPMSATRMALTARAAELARLDVIYLRHDLRNIGIIAGLMLAIIIGLSFGLH
jgi:hypothetical protein